MPAKAIRVLAHQATPLATKGSALPALPTPPSFSPLLLSLKNFDAQEYTP